MSAPSAIATQHGRASSTTRSPSDRPRVSWPPGTGSHRCVHPRVGAGRLEPRRGHDARSDPTRLNDRRCDRASVCLRARAMDTHPSVRQRQRSNRPDLGQLARRAIWAPAIRPHQPSARRCAVRGRGGDVDARRPSGHRRAVRVDVERRPRTRPIGAAGHTCPGDARATILPMGIDKVLTSATVWAHNLATGSRVKT